jgi:menaquinone-specific isochorismate synthase
VKVFWRNKEGEKAPEGATFRLIPFSKQTEATFSTVIHELPSPQKLSLKSQTHSPSRSSWKVAVEDALRQIELGSLEKVVLARVTTLVFDQEIDPFRFTAALRSKTQGAALFCAELPGGKAFVGLSPERLFRRKRSAVITEAVAGTRRVGAASGEELIHSVKDLKEFRFVEEYLKSKLLHLCEAPLNFSPVRLHQTAHVQHLFSEAQGTLLFPDDTQIIRALHPTPAVCGVPQEEALRYVEKTEPFQRDWYAGVIGWSTENASEWAVGIRSCLIEKNSVKLYAGTGIVQGSNWAAEWDELEAKIALYGELCGL